MMGEIVTAGILVIATRSCPADQGQDIRFIADT